MAVGERQQRVVASGLKVVASGPKVVASGQKAAESGQGVAASAVLLDYASWEALVGDAWVQALADAPNGCHVRAWVASGWYHSGQS